MSEAYKCDYCNHLFDGPPPFDLRVRFKAKVGPNWTTKATCSFECMYGFLNDLEKGKIDLSS